MEAAAAAVATAATAVGVVEAAATTAVAQGGKGLLRLEGEASESRKSSSMPVHGDQLDWNKQLRHSEGLLSCRLSSCPKLPRRDNTPPHLAHQKAPISPPYLPIYPNEPPLTATIL